MSYTADKEYEQEKSDAIRIPMDVVALALKAPGYAGVRPDFQVIARWARDQERERCAKFMEKQTGYTIRTWQDAAAAIRRGAP